MTTTKQIRRYVVWGVALGLALVLAFSSTVYAQSITSDIAVPQANLNVRTGPATSYPVILTTPQGSQLTVLGQDVTGAWLSVRLSNGTEGWVARFLTDFTATVPTVTTPPLAPPAVVPTDAATIVTADPASRVNIRSGPATAYQVIRTVPAGTQMTVLGQDVTTTWLSVRLSDGTEGWVARFLTDFTAAVDELPAPALTQPPLAPPATVTGTAPAVTPLINIRTGPATAYPVIRSVPSGTQLSVLGQDVTGAWLSVRLSDGQEGWVARFLTEYTGTAPTVATPPLTQPPLAPPATTTGVAGLPIQLGLQDATSVQQALNTHWRSLNGGATDWYVFRNSGNEQPLQIWMESKPNQAATFHVYSKADAQAIMAGRNPDEFAEIGSGTPNPDEPGDYFWRGSFTESGSYYVMVQNPGTSTINYTLVGSGPGFGNVNSAP